MITHLLAEKLKKVVSTFSEFSEFIEEDFEITMPRQSSYGDWSSNISFILSKKLRNKDYTPLKISGMISQKWNNSDFGKDITTNFAAPGFLNFSFSDLYLSTLIDSPSQYSFGKGQKVFIEFSSPNIAKEMHVGHIRSTVIGASLVRLANACGFTVFSANHIGDWGTPFGKLIAQYIHTYGRDISLAHTFTIAQWEKLYVAWHAESELNKELIKNARMWLVKLQNGDEEAVSLWREIKETSMKGFQDIYDRLEIVFTDGLVRGESYYHNVIPSVIKDALSKGAFEGDPAPDGTRPFMLDLSEYGIAQPIMLRKADGGYPYAATDLAALKIRAKEFPDVTSFLYVVGNEQSLHLQQVFAGAHKLGYISNKNICTHVKFGRILGEHGKKFSTRDGTAIRLQELLNRAVEYAREVTSDKNPSLLPEEREKVSEILGVGAVLFADLGQHRTTDITFAWDSLLDFSGDTSAYIQYAVVRATSVVKKLNKQDVFFDAPFSPAGRALAVTLHRKEWVWSIAWRDYAPHLIAEWAMQVAKDMTNLYHETSILKASDSEQRTRLYLLKNGINAATSALQILGIKVPDKM